VTQEPLHPTALRRAADPRAFGFATTAELEPLERLVGQDRALEALAFGIAIDAPGFNVFILGDEGTGRRSSALDMLRRRASQEPGPDDWCYINDFADPRRPRALRLPAGLGRRLAADLEALILSLASELPRVLGSDEYQGQRKALIDRLGEVRKQLFQEAEAEAERRGLAVVQGPQVILLAPKVDGQILSDEDLAKLPVEERRRFEEGRDEVQKLFEAALHHFAEEAGKAQEALRELNRRTIEATLSYLMRGVRTRYRELPGVIAYLDAAEADLATVINKISTMAELDADILPRTLASEEFQRRYLVNALITHDGAGAPVVEEPNPTFANLLGRIEHRVLQGVLTTDFTMIRAGALLRANGGYLVLEALEVLRRPLAWEALKRALKEGKLKIEEPGAELGLISTISLDPEPIPLKLKIVLLGSPYLYYLLSALDPDFAQIFKVKSDFGPTIPRTPEAELEYARFVEARRRAESLPEFGADAVAALVEYGSRLAADQTRLTARLAEIEDLIREAGFHSRNTGAERVDRAGVEAAIVARRRRLDRLEEELHRMIETGVLLVQSSGAAVGQLNGLSVSMPGDYAFARPTRISASVAMGSRGLIDIQREAQLGGPIHSKAVLILSGYLQQTYGGEHPLVLNATLGFEQVYDLVEGDSASLAELLAIISALARLPMRQDLAFTGSVSQGGLVQPVGAVTQKVEGFFHACRIQGLTGSQGVVLPASNVQHLMLHPEVVTAAAEGRFQVYAVATVDQAIALSFDRPADQVHQAAKARLESYIAAWRRLRNEGPAGPQTPPH
jgi:lon-related putative ATP-dependent protease